MPERIQLSRARGWRKPEGAIVVARPSRWGNPFVVVRIRPGPSFDVVDRGVPTPGSWAGTFTNPLSAHRLAVDLFDLHTGPLGSYEPDNPQEWLAPLRGRDLACWCPLVDERGDPWPCHAASLIRWSQEVFGAE